MIRIRQLKLKIDHTEEDLKKKIQHTLHLKPWQCVSYIIRKQSLDARKKPDLFYTYTVDVEVSGEASILQKNKNKDICKAEWKEYSYPQEGTEPLIHRPVVIGCGPAGMFCTYILAELGYRPILLERGADVDNRCQDVEHFWKTGELDTRSNVQFGEGGAGTFSDGKLNTLVKDPMGRNHKVLEIFVANGASEEILYRNKPHIGTDVLAKVVKNMRKKILANGGNVHFYSQVTAFTFENGKITGLTVTDTRDRKEYRLDAETIVLAIGHSARDTFQVLNDKQVPMEAKAFAVGIRMEHPQEMIDLAQYGQKRGNHLPAADYKLTAQLESGRSGYTFCMCPGGYVVNASSEKEMLAVNGMSYHDRSGENANSAVIITVRPEDFPGEDVLAGVEFQRNLEHRAYEAAGGKIPVQQFADFCKNKASTAFGEVKPQMRGLYELANVRNIFPEFISHDLEETIHKFDRKIPGYARKDAIVSGVESRTSSPVRILRDQSLQSEIRGLYPCGEGAGYAGGITSAAMDGIKVAEKIVQKYHPFDRQQHD